MKSNLRPKIGSILSDHAGVPCIVIKSWPWEDRIVVLKNGNIMLEMIANLRDLNLDRILNNHNITQETRHAQ